MKYFNQLHTILLGKGIYLGPSGYEVGFISSAHTYKELDKAAAIITSALDKILG